MSDIRVLIVSDDPLVRAGLAALLAHRPGFDLVGQVSPDDALPDVYRPDVLLWDLGWDVESVPDRLADLEGDPPVVALLPSDEQAAAVWAAGVRGLLLRSAGADQLAAALVAAVEGLAVFDPTLAAALPQARPEPPGEALTPRELDVLRLLAEGLPNKVIAQRLDISDHTVKFHLNAILGKLNAQSRTEAVVRAIRRGLIAL